MWSSASCFADLLVAIDVEEVVSLSRTGGDQIMPIGRGMLVCGFDFQGFKVFKVKNSSWIWNLGHPCRIHTD